MAFFSYFLSLLFSDQLDDKGIFWEGMVPLDGQIILNPNSAFSFKARSALRSVLLNLKKLKLKQEGLKRLWFIDLETILKEKSLRVFYLPIKSIEDYLFKNKLERLPDPSTTLIGFYMKYAREDPSDTNLKFSSIQDSSKEGNISRKTKVGQIDLCNLGAGLPKVNS